MQKLVSRNPVQRFKQGQKILKAQKGQRMLYLTDDKGVTNEYWRGGSDWYYRPKGGTGMTRVDYSNKRFYSSTPRGAVANDFDTARNYQHTDYSWMKGGTRQRTPEEIQRLQDPKIQAYQQRIQQTQQQTPLPNGAFQQKVSTPKTGGTPVRRTPNPTFYGTKAGGRVTNGLGTITPEQKAKLIGTGQFTDADFASTKSLQTALNKYFAADNAGSIKVDNLWGDQTQKAFNLALNKADTPQIAGGSAPNPTVFTAPQAPTLNVSQLPKINVQTPARTFNRSEIRQYMRDKGVNPYSFTGDQRKALRMVMNGQGTDNDKAIVQGMGLFKKGGNLPSRNPVTRFKMRGGL